MLDDKGGERSHASKMHIICGREVPCKHCTSQGEERSHVRIAYIKGEKRSSTKEGEIRRRPLAKGR